MNATENSQKLINRTPQCTVVFGKGMQMIDPNGEFKNALRELLRTHTTIGKSAAAHRVDEFVTVVCADQKGETIRIDLNLSIPSS